MGEQTEPQVKASNGSSDDKAAKAQYDRKDNLSVVDMLAYSHLRLIVSGTDFTIRPARFSIYIEALKMSPSTQGAVISMTKTLDLLLGFFVGKLSDSCRSRMGRRKPFILICAPLFTLCFLLFCTPTIFFKEPADEPLACANLMSGTCSALKTCLVREFNITAARPSGDIPDLESTGLQASGLLSLYFFVSYFGYYIFGWTGTNIPYDALGMELTDDSNKRSLLFGIRGFFQLLGYTIPIILQMVLNGFFAEDVPMQFAITGIVLSVWSMLAVTTLVCRISERPARNQEKAPVPMVPMIRRMLANKPYLYYMGMRVPMHMTAMLPSNLTVFFVKFVLEKENYIGVQSIGSMIYLFAAVMCMHPMIRFARCCGRGRVTAGVLLFQAVAFGAGFLLPVSIPKSSNLIVYIFMFCVGVGQGMNTTLPDAMLADIIDYDELLTGDRNEGMYTVVETNTLQFTEIIGGVLPLMFMSAAGYASNGGCVCGCGISCANEGMPYARWHCPSDVGYSCTGEVGSDLFFGDAARVAPCINQNASVQFFIKFFFTALPCLLALMSFFPAWLTPISADSHKKIISEIMAREQDASYVCTDPLTGSKVSLPANSEEDLLREHFSNWEQQLAATATNAKRRLGLLVCSELVIMMLLVLVLAIVVAISDSADAVALGCLGIAMLLLGVAWHGLRLKAVSNVPKTPWVMVTKASIVDSPSVVGQVDI